MDAIELLVSQHHTLESLLRSVPGATEPWQRRGRLLQVADAMARHMVAEESLFYPVLRLDTSVTHDYVQAVEEHRCLTRMLASLLSLSPLSREFIVQVQLLREELEQHHFEEEVHAFPRLRELLDSQRRSELGAMLERQQGPILSLGPAPQPGSRRRISAPG